MKIKFTYTIKNYGKGSAAPKLKSSKIEQVDADDLPAMISASVEFFEYFSYDVMPLDSIRSKLREVRKNFVDIEFLPIESNIYPLTEGKPFGEIVWKRPKDFMVVDPSKGLNKVEVFDKKIEPDDIKQGQLGDCWFMCALASLAEMPYLVERLFVT